MTYDLNHAHYESEFEKYIVNALTTQGWLVGESAGFNMEYALFAEDVVAWVQTSQPEKWQKLTALHGSETANQLLKMVNDELERKGTLDVLKNGVRTVGGGVIAMSETAPEDDRNEKLTARYNANRLRVVNQLKYNPARHWAIDLVLFINGLPIATVELKTDFNQPFENAKNQYRQDRLPIDPKTRRKEPLLLPKRGAIVHFAMTESEIAMTTKLDGANTFFLPFNQGNNGHAGNLPAKNGDYPTAYFWNEICQKDNWLRIFQHFVYMEKKQSVDLQGNWKSQERLIFPRYHQFAAVSKIIADVQANGSGKNYLCEHSAGSGKTATITWTAHALTRLREADGKALFDSVIVVTDRTVLDDQLQEAIKQLDHQKGLIAAINRFDKEQAGKPKSKQLEEALLSNKRIIIVTIQTFPFVMEAILSHTSLAKQRFAIIVDEAHNAQTGSSASKLQATLAFETEQQSELSIDELLEKIQKSRGQSPNISYFAFTATPKHSTLMLFGRTENGQPATKENKPQPFHRYTMRQAIEEGFILDVLQGYVNYHTAYELGNDHILDEKRVEQKSAKRAIARWKNLHPTNIIQKAQFIVEHFHHNVAHLLNGKAKAMIVTGARSAAMRYKLAIDDFINSNPEYQDYRVLVAFSGSLAAKELQHEADHHAIFQFDEQTEFSEYSANNLHSGADLRKVFDDPEYRLMVVANKFQTGFDQPKLCAMYLDKVIGNPVEVVQTLSRLNRTFPGKDTTVIIDFVNKAEHILDSFKQYDNGAEITDVQDPTVLFNLQTSLDSAEIYTADDVAQFKQAYFKTYESLYREPENYSKHQAIYLATDGAANVFNQRLNALQKEVEQWENAYQIAHQNGDIDGEKRAEFQRNQADISLQNLQQFKSNLAKFNRWYVYLSQLVDYGDPELENFAAFCKLLAKRLNGVPVQEVDVSGILLTGYKLERRKPQVQEPKPPYGEQEKEKVQTLRPITGGNTQDNTPRKWAYLSEIIELISETLGDLGTETDQMAYVQHLALIVQKNTQVMEQVRYNNETTALKGSFPEAVKQAIVQALGAYHEFSQLLLTKDEQALGNINKALYRLLKENLSLVGKTK
ncbi:DEAD/DEAH box helicase family protein [Pasteurellaceae bacterium LIM206]|nr:DEAD/DEAH box helicase family protein [Pasteurellaceae bacterium LIM206]